MYSTFAIRHEGKAYLPDGRVTEGKSELLDCGHPRPASDPQAFTFPWGYVETAEGRREYCLDCCARLEREAIKTVLTWSGYYDLNRDIITDWHGNKLMTITDYSRYHHNFGGRFVAITAVDEYGNTWHGRASYDNGECINMHRSKS